MHRLYWKKLYWYNRTTADVSVSCNQDTWQRVLASACLSHSSACDARCVVKLVVKLVVKPVVKLVVKLVRLAVQPRHLLKLGVKVR